MTYEKDDPVEVTFDSDREAKYRIGEQLHNAIARISVLESTVSKHGSGLGEAHDAIARISVLETITGKHGSDLSEVKAMISKLDSNLTYRDSLNKLGMDALKRDLMNEMALQFAQHERRENQALADRENKAYEMQRRIMASLILIMVSVIGSLAWFVLDRVQLG